MGGSARREILMRLIMLQLVDNNYISDAYRRGVRIGKKLVAGIATPNYNEDEIRGLIMVLETATFCLKSKLRVLRQSKQSSALKSVT